MEAVVLVADFFDALRNGLSLFDRAMRHNH